MFRIDTTYNIFISHSWDYHSHYDKVLEWLKSSNIKINDYSVPITDPFDHMSKNKLKEAITEQIRHASVVIILGGMYAFYSEWIDYEIDEAIRMNKTILGIYPWGQERTPLKITSNATLMVRWNQNSVVQGFKYLV